MNIAVIFAGGIGKRMQTKGIPKQFLEINDVPVIIHTLKIFENSEKIDSIIIACLKTHIDHLENLINEYKLKKVTRIVPGGETGQQSIINGLIAAEEICEGKQDIVLIHDGVRPIIDTNLIEKNIENTIKYGTSISCILQKETTVISENHNEIERITERANTYIARAPQTFFLKDILEAERKSLDNNDVECIDSCTVMRKYGKYKKPHITLCNNDNLKITTPEDYYIVKALLDYRKNKSVMGIEI